MIGSTDGELPDLFREIILCMVIWYLVLGVVASAQGLISAASDVA